LRRLRRKTRHACGGCGRSAVAGRHARRYDVLGVGSGIGCFEIDDVAQKNFAFVQLVAPDNDRLEGERALAQPRDHRLAASFDALGDGDLALARQELDRAHFAQIHAHRIVSTLARLLGFRFRRCLGRDFDQLAALGLFLFRFLACAFFLLGIGLLGLDDVDAHLAHHREHVFDLFGGHLLRRHDRIELFIGDIAALLGALDHLLDGGVGQVEQRQRRIGRLGGLFLRRLTLFLRGNLGLGRDRFDARALACHIRLHERLSLPTRGCATSPAFVPAGHPRSDGRPAATPGRRPSGRCPKRNTTRIAPSVFPELR